MTIERFEDLDIWQEARNLCSEIKKLCNKSDFSKDFRLKDQILGSSGSIMDNIAEGFERGGNKEFINFLGIAKGSCGETRSQLYRSLDFEYISKEEFDNLLQKTIMLSKKLSGFITYLKTSEYKGVKYK
ncbi:MAG TPA: four helix bundle protein [Tenuifilaceae bacterium]|nr:four helix bundle protein [Tenuifilaceae bacterium]